ncbi:DinI-like family protein [Citrobacter sp. R-1.5.2]|uniref:DinI-like family protein n=1 Tax=Citrobacter sp. R-1.5.2 TaxID=3046183 RepID=UPI002B24BDAF|nr:DinI-like family protein [Citrobacter sp. R-1.5.2]MEB2417718.1 DinI-like family protein [Citrobacter sp. R-1.5.2]
MIDQRSANRHYRYPHRSWNFDGLPGAKGIIPGELSKKAHRIYPDADVRVNPMMTPPAINTDTSKYEKEQISRTVQEMFEEAEMWLENE